MSYLEMMWYNEKLRETRASKKSEAERERLLRSLKRSLTQSMKNL